MSLAVFHHVVRKETAFADENAPWQPLAPGWKRFRCRIGGFDMTTLGLVMLLILAAYWLGMHDGLSSRPPVLKGTYDSGEHDDRVEEYGDWH